jgi:hydrogenase maturation protein HypF
MHHRSLTADAVRAGSIRIRGVVQGVGFRPFVYRLAHEHHLRGWVLNDRDGVEIHIEGADEHIEAFVDALRVSHPPAAKIASIDFAAAALEGASAFTIRDSEEAGTPPTARISPDLAVCPACLSELFDPSDRRHGYPYINCTDCGPRYSIILDLPYDRPSTTMRGWPLRDRCAEEYHDPTSRRFHAQPVACADCGPAYALRFPDGSRNVAQPVHAAARLLASGAIVAVKGLGGYHLACDARNEGAVRALRDRKYRKEKPFALMAKNVATASAIVELSADALAMLESSARPIVLAPAHGRLPGIAPDNREIGVMLPYTPLHHLLFAEGAPELLVMTSANRSNEPIAYEDDDALDRLRGIVDAFLVGERPIARRVEDSVVQSGRRGPVFVRRSRGSAPAAVTTLPVTRPMLAVGADLKNALTLVVDGQAFVSQFIGDLGDFRAHTAFRETIYDLVAMYGLRAGDVTVVHDAHPQYASTLYAQSAPARARIAVQHHRAHIASVMAETGDWDRPVLGIAMDGTGYGDDGTIWGCELFVGSVRSGFARVGYLRPAALVGGDAAAESPVQAAAGFLAQIDGLTDVLAAPFGFPARYESARRVLASDVRVFRTTSAGRLFDSAAALLGFTRSMTFEGQAAIWLEHTARDAGPADPYPFPFDDGVLDFRPLLAAVAHDRAAGRDVPVVARAFHAGIAHGLARAAGAMCAAHRLDAVVCSGGVFQNQLLLDELEDLLADCGLSLMVNHVVPANDGGISTGQAALAAFHPAAG